MLSDLVYRLRALFRRSVVEAELDEELRFHLEREVEKYKQAGISTEEGQRLARLALGGPEQVREKCREARGISWVEDLLQDGQYAFRTLRRSPNLTAVVILSLALGIGATTAIFSLMDAVLLKTLPVKDPGQLVQVAILFDGGRGFRTNTPAAVYDELARAPRSFSDVFGFTPDSRTLFGPTGSEQVTVHEVTGNYYSALGVPAMLGRTLTPEDEAPGAPSMAAVLSHSFWTRRFDRDREVLGKTLYLGRTPVTIVGVTPPEFQSPSLDRTPDITVPAGKQLRAGEMWAWARLKPGVTLAQAQPELDVAFQRYLEQRLPAMKEWSERDRKRSYSERARFLPGDKGTPGLRINYRRPLQILLAFTAMVLLVGCANIANLLLARAAARESEIGLRLAIGAGRRRLVRQLLTESVLLSVLGAAAGMLFAFWAHRGLLALVVGSDTPEVLAFRLDLRVLAFTAGVAVITGVLSGIAPALRASRLDVSSALKRAARHAVTTGRGGLAKSLVVLQVAASVVLLVSAGLFVRTLKNLRDIDPGFERPERLLLISMDAGQTPRSADAVPDLYREIVRRVETLPRVSAAALARTSVLGGGWWSTVWVEGYAHGSDEDQRCGFNNVSPNYFTATGIPLLAGREFTQRDSRGAPEAVIINEKLARRYFLGRNPLGKHLGPPNERHKWEIVGVVADAHYGNLRANTPPMIYHPLLQTEEKAAEVVLHVRVAGDASPMASRIRQEIVGIDKRFPITKVTTLARELDQTLRRERMFAMLSGFFALLALLLSSVGLYGVVAYAAARRRKEIGIRVALGASRGMVVWLVMRDLANPVLLGVPLGLAVALAGTRLARTMLFGLTPNDPETLVAACILLLAVAAVAGYLPARRAALLDPLVALREE